MNHEQTTPAEQEQEQETVNAEQTEETVQETEQTEQEEIKDPAAELAAAKAKAEAAQAAADAAKDQLLRTAAEYENFRKRSAREQDAAFNNGVSFAVNQILVILDTLEMAANAPTVDENYKKGVVMTLDKAAQALEKMNITEIEAMGLPFDPNVMNAVSQMPAPEGIESGCVMTVYQKGYRIGDRIIRHATVIVAE